MLGHCQATSSTQLVGIRFRLFNADTFYIDLLPRVHVYDHDSSIWYDQCREALTQKHHQRHKIHRISPQLHATQHLYEVQQLGTINNTQ